MTAPYSAPHSETGTRLITPAGNVDRRPTRYKMVLISSLVIPIIVSK